MKFGKTILAQQLPEYAPHYINYKALKKIIKSLAAGSEHETVSDEQGRPQTRLQENKATFFFKLERELDKVNAFYVQKEAELRNRLSTLLDKKTLLTSSGAGTLRGSAGFLVLQEGFQQFERDLNKLQGYVDLNATGFYKALKKWDKRSKSHTRELYLSRRVEIQPVFNREVLSNLVDTATSALLDLEAFSQGEDIPLSNPLTEGDTGGSNRSPDLRAMVVRAQDELDSDILKAVTSQSEETLREILAKLSSQAAGNTKPRVTRIFMQAFANAPESSLNVLVDSDLLDFSYRDEISGRLCLHEAVLSGRLFPLQVCLAHNSDIKHADVYGRTALHYACMQSNCPESSLKLLLDHKSPVDVLDQNNSAPLHYSVMNGKVSFAKLLLAHGATVNPTAESDYNALSMACAQGFLDLARLLLENGAKPAFNTEGLLPIHLVARAGHVGFCEILAKHCSLDLEARDKFNGWTPLFFAASEGKVAVLNELIQYGALIDVRDEDHHSPVYYAAWEGHKAALDALLAAGGAFGNTESKLQRPLPAPVATIDNDLGAGGDLDSFDDGIPSLLLPPPILPVRSYGHNYLDRTTLIQILFQGVQPDRRNPVQWFLDETLFSSSKLTVSLKSVQRQSGQSATAGSTIIAAEVIPQTVSLPLMDDDESLVFHVDDPRNLSLEFEIYPTFGSKVIAKAVAPPSMLAAPPKGGETLSSSILPLLDPRLQMIGQVSLQYITIRPFPGVHFDIHSRIETYWKSTQTIGGAGGHVGAVASNQKSASALVTSSSLSGQYLRLAVQLTRDLVPYVYTPWFLPIPGLSVGLQNFNSETLSQLPVYESGRIALLDNLRNTNSIKALQNILVEACVPLRDVLKAIPSDINVNLHILMPTRAEQVYLNMTLQPDVNAIVDAILTDTFDHANDLKAATPRRPPRSLFFSSCNATICTALNWKQPNYPVFFAAYAGLSAGTENKESGAGISPHGLPIADEDRSCCSIKAAVKFSKANNLLGLVLDASVAIHAPALITTVKQSGLVLITHGAVNAEQEQVDMQIHHGVDGVMHEGLCTFVNDIDM
ncbi:phosphate system positive regulatory protein pho81 [Savitreella phatthalungensis]